MTESKERITRVTREEAKRLKGKTDYARLDAMTDEDIARAVAEDPDEGAARTAARQRECHAAGRPRRAGLVSRDRQRLSHAHECRAARIHERPSTEAQLRGRMPRINHIALKVADLEAATKFYENVYGFRQVKTGRSRGHVSRHMTDGYIDLALMVYDSEDDAEAQLVGFGPAIHHFGIEVEDTAAFIAKIEANGGTILENEPGDAVKYRAPDGTISEIVEIGRYEKMKDGTR
jgi:lactoylglutathione lyase